MQQHDPKLAQHVTTTFPYSDMTNEMDQCTLCKRGQCRSAGQSCPQFASQYSGVKREAIIKSPVYQIRNDTPHQEINQISKQHIPCTIIRTVIQLVVALPRNTRGGSPVNPSARTKADGDIAVFLHVGFEQVLNHLLPWLMGNPWALAVLAGKLQSLVGCLTHSSFVNQAPFPLNQEKQSNSFWVEPPQKHATQWEKQHWKKSTPVFLA